MKYEASSVGHEISCVMHGLENSILQNHSLLKETLLSALKDEEFIILNVATHEFSPQGFSIAVLLAESHATIHTYPEHNSLAFHLYSCRRPGDGKKTLQFLKEKFKSEKTDLNEREVVVDPKFKPGN